MQERDEPGMPSLKEIPHVHFLTDVQELFQQ